MSSTHSNHDSHAEEQAALWAAKIDGSSLEPSDRVELNAWLAKNPSHRTLLSQYCQFSADLEQLLPALVESGALAMPKKQTSRAWNLKWLGAASFACAALVVLGFWLTRPVLHSESIASPVGHRQSLTLADGTRIELNAQTSLVVEDSKTERRVRLVSGQACFEVSKDKTRPFIVTTPSGSVRVTGTIFDVRSEAASQLEVTVVEGSVQVRPVISGGTPQPSSLSLTAGDRLSADAKGVSVRSLSRSELEDTLAWRQGQIVFELPGVPLREAIDRFARYHGRAITVTDNAAARKISGRFSLDDVDGFYAALEELLPVRVSHDLNGTVHVSLNSEPQ